VVAKWLKPAGLIAALVKPQFEAGPAQVGKGGVVRDPAVHRQVLERVAGYAVSQGLALRGLVRSPITGPAGNVEFFLHLKQAASQEDFDLPAAIAGCLTGAMGEEIVGAV
jgi:23S rRNA (cytidine1920-2'-O)/16S rRNA (cytidine1409-2'-O)-methyltransferase